MALSLGSKLGPYEIVAAIGAGGMSEVYRANDTRLGRDVAIKVLPQALVKDADRVGQENLAAESGVKRKGRLDIQRESVLRRGYQDLRV